MDRRTAIVIDKERNGERGKKGINVCAKCSAREKKIELMCEVAHAEILQAAFQLDYSY